MIPSPTEIDWGTLGSAELFHFRTTAGAVLWRMAIVNELRRRGHEVRRKQTIDVTQAIATE